jgi:flagellar biosynthetic protein FlhB
MADNEKNDSERSLAPSEKRLRDAREEGQVPRAREISTLFAIGGVLVYLSTGGVWLLENLLNFMRQGLSLTREQAFSSHAMMPQLERLAMDALMSFSPLLLITLGGMVLGMLLLGGWNFTLKPLAPKWSKLDPIAGFQRMFSVHSLGELGKASLAVILLAVVVIFYLWAYIRELLSIPTTDINSSLFIAQDQIASVLALIVIPLVFIAMVDAGLSWWRHYSELKMSMDEVRREQREMEGNPEIKARIRQQQREMARKRMMQAIPGADVVVTNPTHYAVVLKYEEGKMRAPRVVAKGVDLTAARIRGIAAEHNVQMVEAPKLARALYAHTDLDSEIPMVLYTAVAQVLAFVYQLRSGMAPEQLGELEIPDGLDPQEKNNSLLSAAAKD